MKKLLSLALAVLMVLSLASMATAEDTSVTLYYPSYMQESEGETLALDKAPERIVCLSNSALQILVRCDIILPGDHDILILHQNIEQLVAVQKEHEPPK